MKKEKYEAIVVGSGPGGASVALELTRRLKKILILEAGPWIPQKHLGNFWKIAVYPGYYHYFGSFSLSVQGVTIYHTKNVGGTSVFACGNMVRSMQAEFNDLGINLEDCYLEAEKEIGVAPLDQQKIILGSRIIMQKAQEIGYRMGPMSKGGDYSRRCNGCADCVLGCSSGAKWDARTYVEDALKGGAILKTGAKVIRVLFDGNRTQGVKTATGEIFECPNVILAAGGINTPRILQSSGIQAGRGLFIDPYWTVLGLSSNHTQLKGASMSAVDIEFHDRGFVLSPFIDHWSQLLYCRPVWDLIHKFPLKNVLSIMIKISDDRSGNVTRNWINKSLTEADRSKLQAGSKVAKEILRAAGAINITIASRPRGAHPGGSCAIGEVVGADLKVNGRDGLYVVDASVFPKTPGLPPILTIVALGKWLGKRL